MTRGARVPVVTCLIVIALVVLGSGTPFPQIVDVGAADSSVSRLPAGWTVGDVHVHAAGDSGLDGHLHCRDTKSKDDCADRLVRNALRTAKENGLTDPQAQRLLVDAEIASDLHDRTTGIEHETHRTLTQLIGILLRTGHMTWSSLHQDRILD